jgi:hypothetical protein
LIDGALEWLTPFLPPEEFKFAPESVSFLPLPEVSNSGNVIKNKEANVVPK